MAWNPDDAEWAWALELRRMGMSCAAIGRMLSPPYPSREIARTFEKKSLQAIREQRPLGTQRGASPVSDH